MTEQEQSAPAPDTAATQATGADTRYAQAVARVESSGPKPDPAGPDTITDPAWLREKYAKAIERYFTTDWDPTVRTEDGYTRLAAAVHRVRDRHVEQLRQRLALASERHLAVDAWQSAYDRASTAEQQRDQLAGIVRDLYDNSPCNSDHHGHRQTHGNLSETRCPHARAREILAQLDKPKEQ